MVASADEYASTVGGEVLRDGGNAVDAAVAVAFTLAVTFPEAGNLGGGGFLVLRAPNDKATAIDYRETAPQAANRNVYIGPDGNVIKGDGGSLEGYRACGTPGTVAGMDFALARYGSGKMTWARLLEPARKLAADGFKVRPSLARSLEAHKTLLSRFEDSNRVYLNGGKGVRAGDTLRLPDLAETLRRLQQRGPREFYEGETARRIAADVQAHNGLLLLGDLNAYSVKERTVLRGAYRGNNLVSMPPPSSGGVALLQMLGILEGFDLKSLGPNSPERFHLLLESMRRAFADRAVWMGDPDFVRVPVKELLDPAYIAKLRTSIDPKRASRSADVHAGTFAGYEENPTAPRSESPQTTHFSIVDRDGLAISNTYTLNAAFGSGVTAKNTGILINNEMDDFAAKPGTPNLFGLIQGERNAVAGRKRPLSSMTPTIVSRPDGSLWFAVGSPGGPTIINTVLQVIVNVVDSGMDIQEAVDYTRVHHQWLPDEAAHEPNLPRAVRTELEARGQRFASSARRIGDAQAVLVDANGKRHGASDKRGSGRAVSD